MATRTVNGERVNLTPEALAAHNVQRAKDADKAAQDRIDYLSKASDIANAHPMTRALARWCATRFGITEEQAAAEISAYYQE